MHFLFFSVTLYIYLFWQLSYLLVQVSLSLCVDRKWHWYTDFPRIYWVIWVGTVCFLTQLVFWGFLLGCCILTDTISLCSFLIEGFEAIISKMPDAGYVYTYQIDKYILLCVSEFYHSTVRFWYIRKSFEFYVTDSWFSGCYHWILVCIVVWIYFIHE